MSDPSRSAGLRVLVVDDDDDQRMLLRRLLARAGIDDVREAGDGAEAVAAAGPELDLIVLDLGMPVRSGMEILPELQASAPDAQVVVVSNFPRWRVAPLVRARGAVGYVEKRVRPDRLVDEILIAAAMAQRAVARSSTRLDPSSAAPGRARRFVRGVLADDDAELIETVELLVSEMVTNAVVHASSAPRVDVHLATETVRVEVFDDAPELPRPRTPDAGTIGGRGMRLLDRLATEWGSDPVEDGKVVWFVLERAGISRG